jgi:hypothetical protein
MYPAQSNFRVTQPDRAWWYYEQTPGAPRVVCQQAGSGWDFVAGLQEWLVARIRATPAGRVQGLGTVVAPEAIPRDGFGGIGAAVLNAMYGVASIDSRAFALRDIDGVLSRDLREQTVSPETLRLAIWMLHYSSDERPLTAPDGTVTFEPLYNQESPLRVVLPADVVLPRYGEQLPHRLRDQSYGMTCRSVRDWMSTQGAAPWQPALLFGEVALVIGGALVARSALAGRRGGGSRGKSAGRTLRAPAKRRRGR